MKKEDAAYSRALNAGYFYLKFRFRTEKEIRNYLGKKKSVFKLTDRTIDAVVDKLKNQGYINDKKFIEIYVGDRIKNKPKSQHVLSLELQRLGIKKDLIDEYFANYPISDSKAAIAALRKKQQYFLKFPPQKRKEKIFRFLMVRGFSYDDIRKAIDVLDEA